MFDLYSVAQDTVAARLREAETDRLAANLPADPGALRTSLASLLRALASRLDGTSQTLINPSIEPLR